MKIETITILGGKNKSGHPEKVPLVNLKMGDVLSIVGPTGCGKTTLINDIELFADRNTPSDRKILLNGSPVPIDAGCDPVNHPIALISQHTNFLSDLPVRDFLTIHATVRGAQIIDEIMEETLDFANQLTGEAINPTMAMTELSGGQTRSLLIADAVIIGNSPVILLDEIENAGIHRTKALDMLKRYEKIFVFVTHDPRIALLSDFRIVMKNGGMEKLVCTDSAEQSMMQELTKIDDMMLRIRSVIRKGERVSPELMNFK